MRIIKSVVDENVVLAIIMGLNDFKEGVHFHGDKSEFIQVLTFKRKRDFVGRNHRHIKRPREITKTQEVLTVLEGSCEIRVFDVDDTHIFTGVLNRGDFSISYYGGTGYTVLSEETCMMEAKIGPYEVESDDEDRVLI